MGPGQGAEEFIEPTERRVELLEEVKRACGQLGAVSAMFRAVVAAERGLSASEEKAIAVIERAGRITGASIARRLRLTPPTVTELLNRMAKKKLIRRIPSLCDGRSYLVELNAEAQVDLHSRFASFVRMHDELLAKYSDEQLETILDFARGFARTQHGAISMAHR